MHLIGNTAMYLTWAALLLGVAYVYRQEHHR